MKQKEQAIHIQTPKDGDQVFHFLSGWHDSIPQILAIFSDGSTLFCSGVLIREGVILTAAHCLTGRRIQDVFVRFRALRVFDDFSPESLKFRAKHFLINPEYENPLRHRERGAWDVAIIFFDAGELSAMLKPLTLPLRGTPGRTGYWFAMGWGHQGNPRLVSSEMIFDGLLRKVSLPRPRFLSYRELEIPLNSQDRAFCGGDSGGPILRIEEAESEDYRKVEVWGLISRFRASSLLSGNNCRFSQEFRAVNVVSHREWIESQISKYTNQ